MIKKRANGLKYSKITKQQKYLLLRMCLSESKSLQEASLQTGIHYSTAKTILFFHKRQAKAYASFAISPLSKPEPNADLPRASYLPISTQDGTGQTAYRHIPIISSILFPNIRFGRSKYSPRRSGESVREGSTKDEIQKIERPVTNSQLNNFHPEQFSPIIKEEKSLEYIQISMK